MPWGEIGVVLAVLAAIFIIGHAWFYLVEGVLGVLKRLFGRKKQTVWHILPPEQKGDDPQMFDMDELMNRAQAASDRASQQLGASMERSQRLVSPTPAGEVQAQTGEDNLPQPDEPVLAFRNLNFKLAVMNVLMYEKELLTPKFDIWTFAKTYTRRRIDPENEGYDSMIPEAASWFWRYPIPARLAYEVTEIAMDGGDEINCQLAPCWDGEDDLFDLNAIDEAELRQFPNLLRASIFTTNERAVVPLLRRCGIAVTSAYDVPWEADAEEPESKQFDQRRMEMDTTNFAQVYNYVVVDNINDQPMSAFHVERSKKRKGLLAPKVEIIFLEPGYYAITAHGKTYQTTPAMVAAELAAGKYYCLGAAEDGLYIEERPYEWTLK